MAPRRETLAVYVGEDWVYTWDLTDKNGAPWVWDPADTVRGEIRHTNSSGAVIHTWVRGSPDVVASVNGELTLIIPYTVSEVWTALSAVADVEVTRPGNPIGQRRARPISLALIIDRDTTRS